MIDFSKHAGANRSIVRRSGSCARPAATWPNIVDLREKHSILELCKTPELAAQVTLQPIDRFPLDAAIIFADILLPAWNRWGFTWSLRKARDRSFTIPSGIRQPWTG